MALLDDILVWATDELKPWQSDAVRRLFQSIELSDVDFHELMQMLKASKGLQVDAGIPVPVPVPLSVAHLPTTNPLGRPVVLQALHTLTNVNRLAEGQRLTFLPSGITVIYGDNGSGKSGYSRVVKSACRARVKDEPVLPNARMHELLHETPQATFVAMKDGVSVDVLWRDSQPAPKELASVAILDTRCARAYTDQEGELIFAPWGLDVVENMARVVFPRLDRELKAELDALAVSDAGFADLKVGDTAVARFLTTLSPRTTDEDATLTATFGEGDRERLDVLTAALVEKSPLEKAKAIREEALRLTGVVDILTGLAALVSDAEVARFAEIDLALTVAVTSEELAATQLRGNNELLDGTGAEVWRRLFSAAQEFIVAHDHPIEPGRPCPLCQTPLSDVAAGRLERFAAYVANEASTRAYGQRLVHQSNFEALRDLGLRAQIDRTTLEHLEAQEAGWTEKLNRFDLDLRARRAWMINAGNTSHDWESPPAIDLALLDLPHSLVEVLKQSAATLDAVREPSTREAMQKEAAELKARQALALRRDALLQLLAAMRTRQLLTACLADVKTKPVSDKAGLLASSAVTEHLSRALNDEFVKLGVAHLHTSLRARNEKGTTKVKLLLDLPGFQRPELVLSEGEQRVIAIGSFFAELHVSNHQGTAVFDDPVSSLDQVRRQNVARRLVEEAGKRQVVVFTHDTVFLAELIEAIEREQVAHLFHHLSYSQEVAGVVNEGLPWHHQKTSDRIDKLEKLAGKFSVSEPTMDSVEREAASRDIYGKLRGVVERGIEEVVFSGVLRRYNDYIRVPNIVDTVGLTLAECQPIVSLYKRVSDAIEGHDKAGARGFAAPSASQVTADIASLRAALDAIKKRRNPPKVGGVLAT